VAVTVAEADDLVLDRRAMLLIWPEYIGERCTLARITSWVAGVVRVMPHWICGVVIRSVMTENGSGGSSPGCISTADQSMVVPSSRGGVPVFNRPRVKPARSKEVESPKAGASPTRPAGQFLSPRWISPRRKVPVVMTTAPQASSRPSPRRMPVTRPPETINSSASPSMTLRLAVSIIAACMAAA